jgi:phosphohistidine phosphatase
LKTIYLLRHAKANAGLNDLERDLSAKGRRQAEYIGQWMGENGIIPDRIVSSPAKRTTVTASLCAEQAGYQGKIHLADDLYDAHSNTYIDLIAGLDNKHDSVMVVGHNPEISAVVTVLTGEPLTMPPGTLVCIEMTTDQWIAAKDGNASLKLVHNMGTPY